MTDNATTEKFHRNPFKKPVVTVIGGGIAGLTAAHELIERGFEVYVVEKKTALDKDKDCHVGGMAASQYGRVPEKFETLYQRVDDKYPIDDASKEVIHRIRGLKMFRAVEPILLPFFDPIKTTEVLNRDISIWVNSEFVKSKLEKTQVRLLHAYRDYGLHLKRFIKASQSEQSAFSDFFESLKRLGFNDKEPVSTADPKSNKEGKPADPNPAEKEVLNEQKIHLDAAIAKEILCVEVRCIIYSEGKFTEDRETAKNITQELINKLRTPLVEPKADEVHPKVPESNPVKPRELFVDSQFVSNPCVELRTENTSKLFGKIEIKIMERRVPGEHGFRFFPSYYRHLFDIMKRTPILDEKNAPTSETAFDQLVEVDQMDIARHDGQPVLKLMRTPPTSFAECREAYKRMSSGLDITPHDMQKQLIRIIKYATSSSLRREKEYEKCSWMDFLGGETNYSPSGAQFLTHMPRALAGMLPKEVDARTHGNIQLQLLLDFFRRGEKRDMTLNGPTSEAWLIPWKRYLTWQGVKFINGEVLRLDYNKKNGLIPAFGADGGITHKDIDESLDVSLIERVNANFREVYGQHFSDWIVNVEYAEFLKKCYGEKITEKKIRDIPGNFDSLFSDKTVGQAQGFVSILEAIVKFIFNILKEKAPHLNDKTIESLSIYELKSFNDIGVIDSLTRFWIDCLHLKGEDLVRVAVIRTLVAMRYLHLTKYVIDKKIIPLSVRFSDPFRIPPIVKSIQSYLKDPVFILDDTATKKIKELVIEELIYQSQHAATTDTEIDGGPDFNHKKLVEESDFFVLAVPVEVAARLVDDFVKDNSGLESKLGFHSTEDFFQDDLKSLYHWTQEAHLAGPTASNRRNPDGSPKEPKHHPYRDISGIQFFFSEKIRVGKGHVYFPDSPWALTSISQPDKWRTRTSPGRPFFGQNTVDIGDFYTRGKFTTYKSAWNCSKIEIARETLSQLLSGSESQLRFSFSAHWHGPAVPNYYYLDSNLEFKAEEHGFQEIALNHAPFLINLPGQWRLRPGLTIAPDAEKTQHKIETVVSNERWVLAGTYTATYTRMTSMESACESGRHAVNAILKRLRSASPGNSQYNSAGMDFGDDCEIWPLETCEPLELQAFKELDETLARKGLPHFLDILGIVKWVDENGSMIQTQTEMGGAFTNAFKGMAAEMLAKKATGAPAAGKGTMDHSGYFGGSPFENGKGTDYLKKVFEDLSKLGKEIPFGQNFGKSLETISQVILDGIRGAMGGGANTGY